MVDIVWTGLDCLIIAVETLAILALYRGLDRRSNSPVFRAAALAILFAAHIAHRSVAIPVFSVAVSALIDLCYALVVHRGQRAKIALLISSFYSMALSLDLLALFPLPYITDIGTYTVMAMVITRALLFGFSLVVRKAYSTHRVIYDPRRWLAFLPVTLCTAITLAAGFTVRDTHVDISEYIGWLTVFFSVLLIFFVYAFIRNAHELISAKAHLAAVQEVIGAQKTLFAALTENYRTVRKTVHDYRHHINQLAALLKDNRNDAALKLLGQLDSGLGGRLEYTKNAAIDAVLYALTPQFDKAGVRLFVMGGLPAELPFAAEDLYLIVGNALENALEASIQLSEGFDKKVVFRLIFDKMRLQLHVKNSMGICPIALPNGLYPSTKAGEGHGLGLEIIREICGRNGGYLLLDCENNTFELTAVLVAPMDNS
ncbi:GHKL domain-containing protein [Oscillospiraceae bacterium OttesenSCG-928-F05]|nr:GHKL domain-containing protein [Oscillospiraceae bacterium OttesenSCG-928-F05]